MPSVLVFGRLPLVSVPANLLAVPVAGSVMLYGLPAALVAGPLPVAGAVVMFPALRRRRAGSTRWRSVASARAEPPIAAVGWVGWRVVAVAGRRRGVAVGAAIG